MCQNSSLEILSSSPNGYIGKCDGCQKINVVFENIFILLEENELKSIGRIIDESYGIWMLETYIGKGKKITMQTPLPNLYFAFTVEEYEELKRLINEAMLIIDARNILKQPFCQN